MPRSRYTKRSRQPVGNFQRCNDPSMQPEPPRLRLLAIQSDNTAPEQIFAFDQAVIPPESIILRDYTDFENPYTIPVFPVDPVSPAEGVSVLRFDGTYVEFFVGRPYVILESDNPNLKSARGSSLLDKFGNVTAL